MSRETLRIIFAPICCRWHVLARNDIVRQSTFSGQSTRLSLENYVCAVARVTLL